MTSYRTFPPVGPSRRGTSRPTCCDTSFRHPTHVKDGTIPCRRARGGRAQTRCVDPCPLPCMVRRKPAGCRHQGCVPTCMFNYGLCVSRGQSVKRCGRIGCACQHRGARAAEDTAAQPVAGGRGFPAACVRTLAIGYAYPSRRFCVLAPLRPSKPRQH